MPGHYRQPSRVVAGAHDTGGFGTGGGTVMRRLRGTVPSEHPRDSHPKADPKVTG
jgi:hypothetical protein